MKQLNKKKAKELFDDIYFKETQYGFDWGAASINRICSDAKKKWVVFEITTPKISVQIYVTKTGKIRIYSHGEWTPPKKEDV